MTDRDRPDAVLVRAAREGSEVALETLFLRHWPQAVRSAYLICHDSAGAEDIAQEAFLSAVGALERFDRRRPFAPWLHRIVVNQAIDWTRRQATRLELATPEPPEPDDRLSTAELASDPEDDLLAALAELDPDQRAVIVLRYLHDLSPGEISRLLGAPRGTVNSRLRRGLDRLATRLEPARTR